MEGPEKPESESQKARASREEAAAEIEAGGRRKEIADEACMKLSERKGKTGSHSFV